MGARKKGSGVVPVRAPFRGDYNRLCVCVEGRGQ